MGPCRSNLTPDAALEAYGNARILTGQPQTSLLVAATALAQTRVDRKLDPDGAMIHPRTPSALGEACGFVTALRAIIRPYLSQGYPQR